jgi:hypothetical protein
MKSIKMDTREVNIDHNEIMQITLDCWFGGRFCKCGNIGNHNSLNKQQHFQRNKNFQFV